MKKFVFLLSLISIPFTLDSCSASSLKSPTPIFAQTGNEIPISVRSGDEEEDPVAVWDGSHYLVIWQSTRNGPARIYGTQMTGSGKILEPDGFPISSSSYDQLFPALAWGKKNCLVVWQDLRSKKSWEIYGTRMNSSGQRIDPVDIPIGQGSGSRKHPAISWDGSNFLVVWTAEHQATGWDIMGARVSPEGKVLDPAGISISQAEGDQTAPALIWNGKNFLVVWMDGRKKSSRKIYGTRVSREGMVLDPAGTRMTGSPGDQVYPALSGNGKTTLMIWIDHQEDGQFALYGARLEDSGKVIDPEGVLLSKSVHLQMFPDLACRLKDCLVVWEEEIPTGSPMTGIRGIIRNINGLLMNLSDPSSQEKMPIVPNSPGNHFSRVSTDKSRYLAVWKDYRSGLAAVYGKFLPVNKDP